MYGPENCPDWYHETYAADAAAGAHTEWLCQWPAVAELASAYLPTSGPILDVGCGNSLLPVQLHAAGFQDVTGIDLSLAAILHMRREHAHLAGLSFEVMDARQLAYEDGHFGAVVEKGTLEAIGLSGQAAYLQEVSRVLRPASGIFMTVTHTAPEEVRRQLVEAGAELEVLEHRELPHPSMPGEHFYAVVCRRTARCAPPREAAPAGALPAARPPC